MNTLTARILAILSSKPMTSIDIWDALADNSVRLADLRDELHALCVEGTVASVDIIGRPLRYSLAAQAVAS
jgi:hypothetical protein